MAFPSWSTRPATASDVALLLHGFPESRFSWGFQLPLLADLGWRAIAPDLRGYGHSSRPPAQRPTTRSRQLVEDVAGLFEAAGAKRRLLIGHDWGGIVAWAFAVQKRLPLDGLIIMNAPHPAVFGRVMQRLVAAKAAVLVHGLFQTPGDARGR